MLARISLALALDVDLNSLVPDCSTTGVTCHDGIVKKVDLSHRGRWDRVVGRLCGFGEFYDMEYLDVNDNDITSFCDDIGTLSRLGRLDAAHNRIDTLPDLS